MKPVPVIEVTISETGEVKIDAKCFVGTDCLAATRPLEEALGINDGRITKPEMVQQQTPQRATVQHGD